MDGLRVTLGWGLPNKRVSHDLDLQLILYSDQGKSVCLVHPKETSKTNHMLCGGGCGLINSLIACHQTKHEAELLPNFEQDLQEWDCKNLQIDAFHRNERCCHAIDEAGETTGRVRKSEKDEKISFLKLIISTHISVSGKNCIAILQRLL